MFEKNCVYEFEVCWFVDLYDNYDDLFSGILPFDRENVNNCSYFNWCLCKFQILIGTLVSYCENNMSMSVLIGKFDIDFFNGNQQNY